ncbi:MAG: peroxiredoxin [Candidatus Freyarchaeum deiterrae]
MERKIGSKVLKVGDKAPDFALRDHRDKEFKLSDFRGKKVLLSFHPLAWTSVCADQMKSLESNKAVFDDLNTVAVGLSVDATPTKNAWAESLGIKDTRLLSDFWPHGDVAKRYGVFLDKPGISGRANIIIDENGKVEFIKVYPLHELPPIDEVINYLKTGKKPISVENA